jgi:hypothetical protein
MGVSLYKLLGVDRDADEQTIRRAYRERVKEHHPDVSDESGSVARFKRLTTARDVLADETERTRYDRLGHDAYVAAELDADRWGSSEGRDRAVATADRTDRSPATAASVRTSSSSESAAASGPSRSGQAAATTGRAAARMASVGPTDPFRAPTARTETATAVDRAVNSLTTVGPWLLVHAVFLVTAAAAAGVLVVRAGTMPVLSLPVGTTFFGLALFLSALHVVSLVYV